MRQNDARACTTLRRKHKGQCPTHLRPAPPVGLTTGTALARLIFCRQTLTFLGCILPLLTTGLAMCAPMSLYHFSYLANELDLRGIVILWGGLLSLFALLYLSFLEGMLPFDCTLSRLLARMAAAFTMAAVLLPLSPALPLLSHMHSLAARLSPTCMFGSILLLTWQLVRQSRRFWDIAACFFAISLCAAFLITIYGGATSFLELYAVLALELYFSLLECTLAVM